MADFLRRQNKAASARKNPAGRRGRKDGTQWSHLHHYTGQARTNALFPLVS